MDTRGRLKDAVTPSRSIVVSRQLIAFLRSGIAAGESAHVWLQRFAREILVPWRQVTHNPQQESEILEELITKTDPARGNNISFNIFAGGIEGSGRVSLSTLHSAKGREFDAVILYGVNAGDIPSNRDKKSPAALREARRLFYVGVARPRKELAIVFQEKNNSPWVAELYSRSGNGT